MEDFRTNKGWMHQYLEFADGKLKGEGTDYVGPWTLAGEYDLDQSQAVWVKQYVGKHAVNYSGKISEDGITGTWNIRGLSSGPFHVWPQRLTQFDSMYMQEELERSPMRGRSPGTAPDDPFLA